MKSRTSSCKLTALRKNITRFAPVWVLYIVASLMGLAMAFYPYDNYNTGNHIITSIIAMGIVNLIYALLVAQLLFGDLFQSRMCNALHAMPLTRGDWFSVHVTSGLLFAFIPNLIFTLLSLPFIKDCWEVGFYWMLAVDLQYLFFFGVAIFSVFCTGSRFAMAVVYCLINFLSLLFWWFADLLYQPMLYGIDMDTSIFMLFCPVVQIFDFDFVTISHSESPILPGSLMDTYEVWVTLADGWDYLIICAVIGIGLGALGLWLYHKRNLEVAGDFIAVNFLKPVFLVLFSLTMGAMFQLTQQLFGFGSSFLFLFVGIIIGFYLGRMLLMRTTRVFQPKSLFTLASLIGLLLASIGFVGMDVAGIIRWVPEVKEVKSVTVASEYLNYGYNNKHWGEHFTVDTAEEIALMIDIHESLLKKWDEGAPSRDGSYTTEISPDVYEHYARIDFLYELADGRTVHRYYTVSSRSQEAKVLIPYFSSVETVLGVDALDLDAFVEQIQDISISGYDYTVIYDKAQIRQLLDAIIADCEAGNMAQEWAFHPDEELVYYFYIEMESPQQNSNIVIYESLDVYLCAQSTIAWLTQQGITPTDYGK